MVSAANVPTRCAGAATGATLQVVCVPLGGIAAEFSNSHCDTLQNAAVRA